MTIQLQARSALPTAISALPTLSNYTRWNNANNIQVVGISKDLNWHWGTKYQNTSLFYSPDDGLTWNTLATFGGYVQDIRETPDGEAMVAVTATSATPGIYYKSTGWSTNKLTATWRVVLTTTGGRSGPWFTMPAKFMGSNGFGVICEYGGQTRLGGVSNNTDTAWRAYRTFDYGNTWEMFYGQLTDPATLIASASVQGTHIHCVAYDEIADRVYLSYGDSTGSGPGLYGTGNYQFMYSDNARTPNAADVVWSHPAKSGSFANTVPQITTIFPTPRHIVANCDGSPYGPTRFPKTGITTFGELQSGPLYICLNSGNVIGESIHQNPGDDNAPIFFGCFGGTLTGYYDRLLCSHDQGDTIFEIMGPVAGDPPRSTTTTNVIKDGSFGAFGPSSRGKVLGNSGAANAAAGGILWTASYNVS